MLVNYSLGLLTFFSEPTEHYHVFTGNVFTTAPVTENGLTMLQWVPLRLNITLCKSNTFITINTRTVLPSWTLLPSCPTLPKNLTVCLNQQRVKLTHQIFCPSVWNMEKHKYLLIILTTAIFKNTALRKTNKRYLTDPLFLFTDSQLVVFNGTVNYLDYMSLNDLWIL